MSQDTTATPLGSCRDCGKRLENQAVYIVGEGPLCVECANRRNKPFVAYMPDPPSEFVDLGKIIFPTPER